MSKKLISVIILVAIVVVIVVLSGNNAVKQPSGPIKIGAALALTGDAAPWGEESLRASDMAVDEINARGGIQGKKLELVIEDMKSSTSGGVSAVTKLVNVDNVNAVMYTWLDSYEGAESSVPASMLMISPDAAIESVNTPVNHPNVFSLWYRTVAKAQVTMDAMSSSNVKTLYIVLQHDSYYTKLAEFLNAEAAKRGITIVGEDLLNTTDDTKTVVAKISAQKPDAVFFGSYDEQLSVNFIKRYYELSKAKSPLFSDEFVEQDLTDKNFSPEWLEGVKYYVPATPSQAFSDKFQARFGHVPMFSADTTYDTVNVLAKYFSDMPSDPVSYMGKTEFDTVTYGKITFDQIGGIVSTNPAITEKEITGGKINPIQ